MLKKKEKELKKKKKKSQNEEKVEVIIIQYTIEPGRLNFNLNKSWTTVVRDGLISYDIDFEV